MLQTPKAVPLFESLHLHTNIQLPIPRNYPYVTLESLQFSLYLLLLDEGRLHQDEKKYRVTSSIC